MKNTLVVLLTEGIGLNKKWKGNYLKLANKPNINYLVSGIYPWALISNTEKHNKNAFKKVYEAVKKDVDSNFYEMLYGTNEIKTYNDMFNECIEQKRIEELKVFEDLVNRSKESNSRHVHVFSTLSNNQNKFNENNLYYIVNVLIKKGLKPILHIISDGQDDRPYSFSKSIIRFKKFLLKRQTPIASICGRNNVFIKNGHTHLENRHIFDYFETLCGIGEKSFTSPLEYANENLANKTMDADIKPAYNSLLKNIFLQKNDSVMFLSNDPDDFSGLASMIKTEPKLQGIYFTSLSPIYGTNVDSLFFENPVENFNDKLITNFASKNELKSLVVALNHKKGFVNKFFGENKNENVERKAISTSFCSNNREYYFNASKLLIDKTIQSIGKYDVVFVHLPMIAEAARTSILKELTFAIETFDKNLGRLLNFCRATGSVVAFTSAYGQSEKMLDKHLNIVPYNKNSPVPFVFTNGDLSSKKMISNFKGIYASVSTTLELLKPEDEMYHMSLISHHFSKNKIGDALTDKYNAWLENIAKPLIENFEETRMNFYSEFSKDEQFLMEKKQYVILKEIIKLHEKILLTSEAREKIFNKMYEYVNYNNVDFIGNNINFKKMLETLFDSEINMQKLSKISNKFFDRKLWNSNFKRNDIWMKSVKFDLTPFATRTINIPKKEKYFHSIYDHYTPFLFFEKTKEAEMKVLEGNDAVAIYKFYDFIKPEVDEIYEKYIGNKITEDDEDLEPEQIEINKQLYDLGSYYEYFSEVCDVVKENKDSLNTFNKKYLESKKYLEEKNISYDDVDLFKKPNIALNSLVIKIIKIYKFYFKDKENKYKIEMQEIKKTSSKYDNNYNLKHSIALRSKAYDGEFLEDVDFNKQNEYHEEFQKHFNLYKEFDSVSIDVDEEEENVFDFQDEGIDYDENGEPIIVDNIDKSIKIRPEYNKSDMWLAKRKEEILNNEDVKVNVIQDAENEINSKKKYIDAKKKVQNYNNLSEIWRRDFQSENK